MENVEFTIIRDWLMFSFNKSILIFSPQSKCKKRKPLLRIEQVLKLKKRL